MNKECALVTGGAGFLGSHVAGHLVKMGLEVVVLDDLSGGFRRNVPPGAELRRGSVTDPVLVDTLFDRHRFDYVFHLAAYAAEALSHFIRRHNYTVNLLGSVNLINAAVRHRTRGFVFTSSIAVYGVGSGPFREDAAPSPADPYGIAKLAVEHDLRAALEVFGLRSIIFRPHNVYGEGQNLSDPYRNVIGIFMNQVKRGLPCSVFGDGSQTRGFSYVGDVAPTIAESVRRPEAYDETFNIGAESVVSVTELALMVQRAMGRDVGIEHLPARHEGVHLQCDHAKLKRLLGWSARVPLEEGLRRMAGWADRIDLAPSRAFGSLELDRNLPASWARLADRRD